MDYGEDQAADFVTKLDTRRYGAMRDQLANNVAMGMAYQNSLRDAWRLANDWTGLSSDIKTSSDMSSVFVAKEVAAKDVVPSEEDVAEEEETVPIPRLTKYL
jgi:hypothetical protein